MAWPRQRDGGTCVKNDTLTHTGGLHPQSDTHIDCALAFAAYLIRWRIEKNKHTHMQIAIQKPYIGLYTNMDVLARLQNRQVSTL